MKKKSLVSDGKGQTTMPPKEEASSWTIHRTTAVAILFIVVFIMGMMTALFLCGASSRHHSSCDHTKTTTQEQPSPQQDCPSVQPEPCAACESSLSKNPRQYGQEEEFDQQRETTSCTLVVREHTTTSSLFRDWLSSFRSNSSAFWNPCNSSSWTLSTDKDNGGSSYRRCSENTWRALLIEILQVVWRLGALVMSIAIAYISHYDMKYLEKSWRIFYKVMACSLMSFGITPVLSILPATATLMVQVVSFLFDYALLVLYHAYWWIEHYKIASGVSFLLRVNALVGATVVLFVYSQHYRYSRDWLQILVTITVFATLAMHGSTLFFLEDEESRHLRLCDNVEYSRDWFQPLVAIAVFATLAMYGSTLFFELEEEESRNVEYTHGGSGENEEEEVEEWTVCSTTSGYEASYYHHFDE